MSEKDGNNTQAEESEHSEDDESDILEESPCGRWLKRNEEVPCSTIIIYIFS